MFVFGLIFHADKYCLYLNACYANECCLIICQVLFFANWVCSEFICF
uniref:Uncharacterized protein n=1 Tax=Rhizophora mucronata TaxID=61149 RepID=A0A2P2NY81_RHIMU